jgi:uncharacterized protein (DUF2252 family)
LRDTRSAGIIVQCCGDCHLMNFGGFASPERALLFDINDFDETLPAPFEWDLKRLATSFVLAARWRKFGKRTARDAAEAAVRSYRRNISKFAQMSELDVWYARVPFDDLMEDVRGDPVLRKRLDRVVAGADKRSAEVVFHKMTTAARGRRLPRIVDQPPLLYHAPPGKFTVEEHVLPVFEAYKETLPLDRRALIDRYRLVDAAFKVVGVGSVGTLCFVTLWMAAPDDALFLQVKQARPSVLAGLTAGKSTFSNDGERVVVGQRIMQSASDIFLGWTHSPRGSDFYVRQLRDHKIAPDVATATEPVLLGYAQLCGRTLARAHAKSGKAAEITGYLGAGGKFDTAVADYAVAYANQVEQDYQGFSDAVRAGRFRTETSPSEVEAEIR